MGRQQQQLYCRVNQREARRGVTARFAVRWSAVLAPTCARMQARTDWTLCSR